MAIRTDAGKVKGVIAVSANCNLTRQIKWATLITDRMVTCATEKGYSHTSEELIEIETLLAAHAYSIFDPQYVSKSTDGASGSFDVKQWAHAAIQLDGSGCLSAILGPNLQGSRVASMDWLGLPPSEQTPFYQRD